jgi:hypothetical protein
MSVLTYYKCFFTYTITYIQYCLKIKTNGFQTFFGGNGNHIFFVLGGKGLWRNYSILFRRKRVTSITLGNIILLYR